MLPKSQNRPNITVITITSREKNSDKIMYLSMAGFTAFCLYYALVISYMYVG